MPCIKCKNGKWRIGNGKCQFDTKKKCEEAMAAMHANKKKDKGPKSFRSSGSRAAD